MELCLYTDSVPSLSFEQALDLAASVGCASIEIATGGQSSAPHLRIDELLGSDRKRAAFAASFAERGLRIAALNCSAWPMHPVHGRAHVELIRSTIRLAELLGVDTIVTMSGTPGDGSTASTFNWIWYPWPDDATELLERQWSEALALWQDLGRFAEDHGVARIAFELHPLHLVYNVPTLLRLRNAAGAVIGANLDPSHLFWQQMDPRAITRTLGPAVHHVHLKDTLIDPVQVRIAGVLDNRPFETLHERAWTFTTVGRGHDRTYWQSFVDALREVGYDGPLSIENEDATQPPRDAVAEAAAFMRPILDTHAPARAGVTPASAMRTR
jgi:sugar phosphate isomerase/epimerase